MRLESEHRGEIIVIRALDDRIDAAGAIQFKERMRELVADPSERVVLDMSNVVFLDSSGLGAVVSVMKALDERGMKNTLLWIDAEGQGLDEALSLKCPAAQSWLSRTQEARKWFALSYTWAWPDLGVCRSS